MKIKDLKKLSISNLILIILNEKNDYYLRKNAEVELRMRIRNVGWDFDDFLHFDDKVIKARGLDIENYLISPDVDLQQLMEAYFMYDYDANFEDNYLLFSEKHLCNEPNFASPFFSLVCKKEIENLDNRILSDISNEERDILITFKNLLIDRETRVADSFEKMECIEDKIAHNEAFYQLDNGLATCHEFLYNISDEEIYKLASTKTGRLKTAIIECLNDTLFDPDIVQNLCGLKFVLNDSMKLNAQKRQLLYQVRNGYQVNYETENMQQVLQMVKEKRNR